MSSCRIRWWSFLLLLAAFFLPLGGCAGDAGHRLAPGETSRIAGYWEGPIKLDVRWSADKGVDTTNARYTVGGQTGITIRADGTFDWSGTMLAGLSSIYRLNHRGDRFVLPADPGDLARQTMEVIYTHYTPTSSRMMIEFRRPAQILRDLAPQPASATRPAAEVERLSPIFYAAAELNADGTLSFSYSLLSLPSHESAHKAAILRRARSRMDLAAEAMKDYPEPPWIINKKVTRRKLKTAAGNEYILLTPRKSKGPMPLIVAIPSGPGLKRAEAHVDCWWRHHVDRFKTAVAIPILTRPRAFDFGFFAFDLEENTTIAAAHAKTVRDVTAAAKRVISPTRMGLVARYSATVIAGVLWQEDNRSFDSLMIEAYYFPSLPAPGQPKAVVRKDTPVSVFYVPASGKTEVEMGKKMAKLYRDSGYTNVMECTTDCLVMDKNEAAMAAIALGREFEGVKITRAD